MMLLSSSQCACVVLNPNQVLLLEINFLETEKLYHHVARTLTRNKNNAVSMPTSSFSLLDYLD